MEKKVTLRDFKAALQSLLWSIGDSLNGANAEIGEPKRTQEGYEAAVSVTYKGAVGKLTEFRLTYSGIAKLERGNNEITMFLSPTYRFAGRESEKWPYKGAKDITAFLWFAWTGKKWVEHY